MRAGGVNVQVVPVFAESTHPESSLREALQYVSAFYRVAEANPDSVAHCLDATAIRAALAGGKIVMLLALEGASCLGNEPSLVQVFHRLGVRMISFTHKGRSWLADGSGENDTGGRLIRAGRAALAETERLGILMDVSHLGIAGTDHDLELVTRPVVASHSSARAIGDSRKSRFAASSASTSSASSTKWSGCPREPPAHQVSDASNRSRAPAAPPRKRLAPAINWSHPAWSQSWPPAGRGRKTHRSRPGPALWRLSSQARLAPDRRSRGETERPASH